VAIAVGILSMLLAALAGYADYLDLEGKTRRFGTVHSSLMLVALVFYLVSFVMRLSATPSPAEVWLSVIGLVIVIGGAYVGGELVYNLGTQVDRHAWRGGGTKWTALDTTDIPPDRPVKARAGAQTLVVVRKGTGLEALHDVCAHQGCSLSEGTLAGDAIECQCHGSRFRLRDGLVVRGPAVYDQPHYEVRETDGKIEVRRTDTQ
jgi:nitrite reductase/ring-hydroxylating ferredoxin subunit